MMMSTVKCVSECCLRLGKASLIHCQEMSLPGGGIHLAPGSGMRSEKIFLITPREACRPMWHIIVEVLGRIDGIVEN